MEQKEAIRGFYTAAGLLPERLWRAAFTLDERQRPLCEELRIRLERPMTASVAGGQVTLPACATAEELQLLLARAAEYSVHTVEGQLAQGFVTTRQGHRLGVCGEAAAGSGGAGTIRGLSSVNLRIAKQAVGIAEPLLPALCGGGFHSTLILAAPGAGKTTLLRDLCRALSRTYRVAIADQRYEIAACAGGVPRFDVGLSDVFSGGARDEVLALLTRGMAPQIIATDEITQAADSAAIAAAAACGCTFLATAHGDGPADLHSRPAYRELLAAGVFRRLITIDCRGGAREYAVRELGL